MSGNVANMQNETQDLQQRVANLQNELNLSMGENERLIEELGRQQALYTELKKMRGRGEEMDMLQQLEQVSKIGGKNPGKKSEKCRKKNQKAISQKIRKKIRQIFGEKTQKNQEKTGKMSKKNIGKNCEKKLRKKSE